MLVLLAMTLLLLGMASFTVALWSLAGDPSRGRRRCPRCWYDMAGGGMECPECGRRADGEREFFRTRRRWRRGAACTMASVTAFAGLLVHLGSPLPGGRWHWLPTSAIIELLAPRPREQGFWVLWYRLDGDGDPVTPAEPGRASDKTWRRLVEVCEACVANRNAPMDARKEAASILAWTIPNANMVDPSIERLLNDPDPETRRVIITWIGGYFRARGGVSDLWWDDLRRNALDIASPRACEPAIGFYLALEPEPADVVRQLVRDLPRDGSADWAWQAIGSGLGWVQPVTPQRLELITELESAADEAEAVAATRAREVMAERARLAEKRRARPTGGDE